MHLGNGYFVCFLWDFEFSCHQTQPYEIEMKVNNIQSQNNMYVNSILTNLKLTTLK